MACVGVLEHVQHIVFDLHGIVDTTECAVFPVEAGLNVKPGDGAEQFGLLGLFLSGRLQDAKRIGLVADPLQSSRERF